MAKTITGYVTGVLHKYIFLTIQSDCPIRLSPGILGHTLVFTKVLIVPTLQKNHYFVSLKGKFPNEAGFMSE